MAEDSNNMSIGGAILALLAGAVLTGGWIAINGMILLERIIYTFSFLSPLVSWTIGGAICGSIAVSGSIVRNWKQSVRFNISLGIGIIVILLLATVNLKRTESYMTAAKSVSESPPVAVSPTAAVPTPVAADLPEKNMPDNPPSDMSNESATLSNQLPSLAGGYAVVVTRTANVRENRSVKASSEYYLDKNERVYVISENGEWCRVKFPFEGKEIEGWVNRKLLAKEQER